MATAARWLVAGVALTLGACASHRYSTLPDLGSSYAERSDILVRLDAWQVKGRIGVRTPDDGFSGALVWRQDGRRVDANLHGPLGVGAIQLSGTTERLELATSDGERVDLVDPERALMRRYGWTVPVDSLRYWLLGIADPAGEATLDIDEHGRLKGLTQFGWTVDFRDYQNVAADELPRRLKARNRDLTLNVSIKDWRIPY